MSESKESEDKSKASDLSVNIDNIVGANQILEQVNQSQKIEKKAKTSDNPNLENIVGANQIAEQVNQSLSIHHKVDQSNMRNPSDINQEIKKANKIYSEKNKDFNQWINDCNEIQLFFIINWVENKQLGLRHEHRTESLNSLMEIISMNDHNKEQIISECKNRYNELKDLSDKAFNFYNQKKYTLALRNYRLYAITYSGDLDDDILNRISVCKKKKLIQWIIISLIMIILLVLGFIFYF